MKNSIMHIDIAASSPNQTARHSILSPTDTVLVKHKPHNRAVYLTQTLHSTICLFELRNFRTSPYLPIPINNIALMAAILPLLSPVHSKHLPTPRTSNLINRLTLDLIEMLVPPYITALVAAEFFFLSVRCLLYCHAAILTVHTVGDGSKTALLTTLAERLDCVEIQSELL